MNRVNIHLRKYGKLLVLHHLIGAPVTIAGQNLEKPQKCANTMFCLLIMLNKN